MLKEDVRRTILTRIFFFFPVAPVLFNRSLCWSSSPSACQCHSALLPDLPKAVPYTSQGKAVCCGASCSSQALSLPLQTSPSWYLDPKHDSPVSCILPSLFFWSQEGFVLSPPGLWVPWSSFRESWVSKMCALSASPYAKWHGGVLGKLSASLLQMECLLPESVCVCDSISLRAVGGIFLQKLSHNCWVLKNNNGGGKERKRVTRGWCLNEKL